VDFETLNVRNEGAVLFVEIAAPPMNLLGPELVRDLVSLIEHAEADHAIQVLVFGSADPDYFISHVDINRITEYRREAARLTGEASIALMFRYVSTCRLVITHPIAIDNHYAISNAFKNGYTPTLYVADAKLRIRGHFVGEQGYDHAELLLHQLLVDTHPKGWVPSLPKEDVPLPSVRQPEGPSPPRPYGGA
jgi:hypothetical protein